MDLIGKRISTLGKENEFSIVISAAADKVPGYFWMFWCALWTACGIIVLFSFSDAESREQKIVLFVFMGFWLYFEWKSVKMFFWKWRGREVIKIRPNGLYVGKRIFGSGNALLLTWDGIQEMKKVVTDKNAPLKILEAIDLFASKNTISIQYFGKEYGLGNELKEEDASRLFSLMKKEIRRYKTA